MMKLQIGNLTLILTTRILYICTFQIILNFHIGQIDKVVVALFRSSQEELFQKFDVLKFKSMP